MVLLNQRDGTQHVATVMHNSRTLTDSSVTLTRQAGTSLQGITRTVSNIQSMNQHMGLADHFAERARTPFTCKNLITH